MRDPHEKKRASLAILLVAALRTHTFSKDRPYARYEHIYEAFFFEGGRDFFFFDEPPPPFRRR